MRKRKSMRSSKVAALVLIVGATSSISVSLARAASDCPTSVTVSDWGENSTGYFNVASWGSCLFPIRMAGAVSSSEISQKPAHGKLKKAQHINLRIHGEGSITPSPHRYNGFT